MKRFTSSFEQFVHYWQGTSLPYCNKVTIICGSLFLYGFP